MKLTIKIYTKPSKRENLPFLNHVSFQFCIVLVYYFCWIYLGNLEGLFFFLFFVFCFFFKCSRHHWIYSRKKWVNSKVIQDQKIAGPTYTMQLNQMTYHCGIFRTNYFLLVFIKPNAKMANSFTFVLFGEFEGSFRGCIVVLLYYPCRYI